MKLQGIILEIVFALIAQRGFESLSVRQIKPFPDFSGDGLFVFFLQFRQKYDNLHKNTI